MEALKAQLEKLGVDYICTAPLPVPTVRVLFLGPFKSRTVVWNMTLVTLMHFQQEDTKEKHTKKSGQFIDIKENPDFTFDLRVGLELADIDEAVIKKTIIMIRNYKRLAIGRIEFGSMHT